MARLHLFADEAGNFDFTRGRDASRYFILTTIIVADERKAASTIQELRYELAWNDIQHPGPFHATTDSQQVRDRFYQAIAGLEFRVDATILEKSKALPAIRPTNQQFYQYAWFYHMQHVARRAIGVDDDLLVVAASLGTRKTRDAFYHGVRDVMRQFPRIGETKTACWSADSDPCLQLADYCCWAIQRKWERSDSRSHSLITDRIATEYDLFRPGRTHHY